MGVALGCNRRVRDLGGGRWGAVGDLSSAEVERALHKGVRCSGEGGIYICSWGRRGLGVQIKARMHLAHANSHTSPTPFLSAFPAPASPLSPSPPAGICRRRMCLKNTTSSTWPSACWRGAR